MFSNAPVNTTATQIIDIPLESTTFPADLHWGVIPQNDHEVAAETDSWNTHSAVGFHKGSFAFYPNEDPKKVNAL